MTEADANQTTLRMRVDGTLYTLDMAKLDFGDFVAIKRITNGQCVNLETLAEALGRSDAEAEIALVFVAMRKSNPQVTEAYAFSLRPDQIEVADPPSSVASPAAAAESDSPGGEVVPLVSREMDEISGSPSTPANTGSIPGISTSQAVQSG